LTKEKILIATTNKGKAQEIRKYLASFPLEVSSLTELNILWSSGYR